MAKTARWTAGDAVSVARALTGLGRRYLDRLSDRDVTAALLDAIDAAASAAEADASGQPVRLGQQKSATASLTATLDLVNVRTGAVRKAILRKYGSRKDLRSAFGVGEIGPITTVSGALAALKAVLDAAAQFPSETAAARIRERDLEALRELRAALLSADGAQESAKEAKKSGTARKDELLAALVAHVDDLLAAAELEFATEPAILAQWRAPLPTKAKKRKKDTPTPEA